MSPTTAPDRTGGPRVAVVGANLSLGGTLAAVTIAQAIAPVYPVRLVGCQFGPELWPGLEESGLDYQVYEGRPIPGFFALARRIVRESPADVVIAHQLRMSSFGIALLHKWSQKSRCILFIDDDDLALTMPGRASPLHRRVRSPTGDLTTRLMHRLRRRADDILCGSVYFADKFGGDIMPLGRNGTEFDPARQDSAAIRRKLGIGDDERVIGFIGNPRPHTGIGDLVEAMASIGDRRLSLLVVPTGTLSDFARSILATPGIRAHVFENQKSRTVPEFLAASDLVVLPQRPESISLGQLPARLVDAMAMAKPIITTAISDIPGLLQDAGLIIPSCDPAAITRAIAWIDQHPAEATAMGQRARRIFLKKLSLESMRAMLVPRIDALSSRD